MKEIKEVVHVPTRGLAEKVLRVAKENGLYKDYNLDSMLKLVKQDELCIRPGADYGYASFGYFEDKGCLVIAAQEFLNRYKLKFRPIAMRCNQEQFDEIKGKLVGCEIVFVNNFNKSPYLVNNLGGKENHVYNSSSSFKTRYDREVFEEWNEKTFLEYCGIEVNDEINEIDQLRKENEELRSINDTLNKENLGQHNELTLLKEKLKAIEDQPKVGDVCLFWSTDSDYALLGKLRDNGSVYGLPKFENCIKATDENIQAKIKELQDE